MYLRAHFCRAGGVGDLASHDFASLIPPTALRLWAPPVHAATGGHGLGMQVPDNSGVDQRRAEEYSINIEPGLDAMLKLATSFNYE